MAFEYLGLVVLVIDQLFVLSLNSIVVDWDKAGTIKSEVVYISVEVESADDAVIVVDNILVGSSVSLDVKVSDTLDSGDAVEEISNDSVEPSDNIVDETEIVLVVTQVGQIVEWNESGDVSDEASRDEVVVREVIQVGQVVCSDEDKEEDGEEDEKSKEVRAPSAPSEDVEESVTLNDIDEGFGVGLDGLEGISELTCVSGILVSVIGISEDKKLDDSVEKDAEPDELNVEVLVIDDKLSSLEVD